MALILIPLGFSSSLTSSVAVNLLSFGSPALSVVDVVLEVVVAAAAGVEAGVGLAAARKET